MTPGNGKNSLTDLLENVEKKIEDRIGKIGTIGLIVYTMSGLNPVHPDPQHTDVRSPTATAGTTVDQRPSVVTAKPFDMKPELDTLLDSMLITQRIPAGVPFEKRVGHVDDPRVLEIMREMDDNLGGRIEWPNVYVAEGLYDTTGADGHHQGMPNQEGRSMPHDHNEKWNLGPYNRFGITLDKKLVEHELETGTPDTHISVRSLLAHELQHATSWDNDSNLLAAADANDWEYETTGRPTAEGRAGLAQLLDRELSQRQAPGPRLNELPTEERRDAIAGILTNHLKTTSDDRTTKELHLYIALKDQAYLWSDQNGMWANGRNEELDRHAYGLDKNPIFVPNDSSLTERVTELNTPLDTIAKRWRNKPGLSGAPDLIPGTELPTPAREGEKLDFRETLKRFNEIFKTLKPMPTPTPAADTADSHAGRANAIPRATAQNAIRVMRQNRATTGAAEPRSQEPQKTQDRTTPARGCPIAQATGPVRGAGQPAGGTPAPTTTRAPITVTRT